MKKVIGFLCAMVLVFGAVGNAQCSVMGYTLGDLKDGTVTDITVGDKIFYDWEVLISEEGWDAEPDLDSITVDPDFDEAGNAGLRFTAGNQLTTAAGSYAWLDYRFSVAVTDDLMRITDNSLELTDYEFFAVESDADQVLVGGFIWIAEVLRESPDYSGYIDGKYVYVDNGPDPSMDTYDEIPFDGRSELWVQTVLCGMATYPSDTDQVRFKAWEQHFSQTPIPEPATVLLLGTGLVGLVGFRKKFKK